MKKLITMLIIIGLFLERCVQGASRRLTIKWTGVQIGKMYWIRSC